MFTQLSSFSFYPYAYEPLLQVVTTTQKACNNLPSFPQLENLTLSLGFPQIACLDAPASLRCSPVPYITLCAYLHYSIYHFDVIKDLFFWLLMFKVPWGHGLYLLMHLYFSSFTEKLDFKKENLSLGFISSTSFSNM